MRNRPPIGFTRHEQKFDEDDPVSYISTVRIEVNGLPVVFDLGVSLPHLDERRIFVRSTDGGPWRPWDGKPGGILSQPARPILSVPGRATMPDLVRSHIAQLREKLANGLAFQVVHRDQLTDVLVAAEHGLSCRHHIDVDDALLILEETHDALLPKRVDEKLAEAAERLRSVIATAESEEPPEL